MRAPRLRGRDGSRGVREAIGCGASGEFIPELLRAHCWLGICAPPFGPGQTPCSCYPPAIDYAEI